MANRSGGINWVHIHLSRSGILRQDLKRKDLKLKHPYNTYYIKGLPPGPIGLVSETALEAVLNPIKTDKLYFVAKGDGSHVFTSNLEDHNAAVTKYQLKK